MAKLELNPQAIKNITAEEVDFNSYTVLLLAYLGSTTKKERESFYDVTNPIQSTYEYFLNVMEDIPQKENSKLLVFKSSVIPLISKIKTQSFFEIEFNNEEKHIIKKLLTDQFRLISYKWNFLKEILFMLIPGIIFLLLLTESLEIYTKKIVLPLELFLCGAVIWGVVFLTKTLSRIHEKEVTKILKNHYSDFHFYTALLKAEKKVTDELDALLLSQKEPISNTDSFGNFDKLKDNLYYKILCEYQKYTEKCFEFFFKNNYFNYDCQKKIITTNLCSYELYEYYINTEIGFYKPPTNISDSFIKLFALNNKNFHKQAANNTETVMSFIDELKKYSNCSSK